MLVGIHTEGKDHLIFKVLLARILPFPEDEIEVDPISTVSGRGWSYILGSIHEALNRFYYKRAQLALIGIDNDGNCDLKRMNLKEDPDKPRHWNHQDTYNDKCRWCQIEKKVKQTLLDHPWPVIIAVPVEQIESWLLAIQAVLKPGHGSLNAENELRVNQKQKFYGINKPNDKDIEEKALTMVRNLNDDQITLLKQCSKSFTNFTEQINTYRNIILQS